MRSLILFFIGIIFGTGTGVLLALPSPEHNHASHFDPAHDHTTVTPWEGDEPAIALQLTPDGDADGSFNLFVDTKGFTFAPEHVNQASVQGEGHAHIYLNGEKIMRIYGPWVHLEGLPSGALLRVSLNTNDHTDWGYLDMPIATEMFVP